MYLMLKCRGSRAIFPMKYFHATCFHINTGCQYILYDTLKAFVCSTVGAKIHRNHLDKNGRELGGRKCLPPCVSPDSASKVSLTLLIGCWCAGDLKGDLLFFSLQYFERGDFLGDRFARVRMYSATLGLRWLTSTLDGDCNVNGQYKENKPIVNY